MPDIKQLPPSVINKIAAGEVIERPASVLKELLENAVDAGGKRIDASLEKGGTESIRVVDDGCGIDDQQLTLAVTSHATSKIQDADDLFRVRTLGFRGEALASIAEVSQFLLRSRPSGVDSGWQLEVTGGHHEEVVPCGSSPGTTVEVRQLFYNTPVRRKFLRTTQTEMGHAGEAFTRIALAQPQVHFTLRHNNRLVWDLPPVEDWRERITTLFGKELAQTLISIESVDESLRLSGYVADPSQSRANNRMQYLFLNGRHIRDRSLQHALGEAYRGLLLTGRYPITFLQLEMNPAEVDVNVHPTKLEVRFQDSGRIYSQLLGTIRTRFLTTDLTTKLPSTSSVEETPASSAHDGQEASRLRTDFVQWAKGKVPQPTETKQQQSQFELQYQHREQTSLRTTPFKRFGQTPESSASTPTHSLASSLPENSAPAEISSQEKGPVISALQVHKRYLITENEEGVVVIDQHALHERILYEHLRERVLEGKLETQQLLVPEPVHLTSSEASAVLEAKELLEQLGIQVQSFGGDTVLISSYPAMLANINPVEVLRQMIEHLLDGGHAPDRRDLLNELLHMISCKAAIKAGDYLSPEEIHTLLEQRHLVQDSHHCPHGRPTSLVFTREELDRRFKRI